MLRKFIIITTINEKTKAIKRFSALLKDWQIILVGDKKSKKIKSKDNIIFLSVEDQEKLNFNITKYLPYNHYCRKNIGYLYAIKLGAEVIYDTDDDNIPYDNWSFPKFECQKSISSTNSDCKFINIYKYFTSQNIWPRGFPLDELNQKNKLMIKNHKKVKKIGAWQGLADIDPDVDAIYRLIINNKIIFKKKKSVFIEKNVYCPFNSQNTLWNKEAFMFIYLPLSVSFRFTDILRGYIAQRLFWQHNLYLGFTKATVYQERNQHNLIRDFSDEIECYIKTKRIINILNELKLNVDYSNNLKKVYSTLKNEGIITTTELASLDAWINDFNKLKG